MKKYYWFFLFVAILCIVVWVLQNREVEHMRVCSHPMEGPRQGDGAYPDIYGPGYEERRKRARETEVVEDDGMFDSTTATRNDAYIRVFKFGEPDLKLAFPTSGPPQPYLTDFSKFHR
jgi:hypothetical protein